MSQVTVACLLYSILVNVIWSYGLVFINETSQDENVDNRCCAFSRHPFGDHITDTSCVIGPPCTMDAHNNYSQCKDECPGAPQPDSGPFIENTTFNDHYFADHFIMDFKIYYVKDAHDPPPYVNDTPNTPYVISYGRTWYDVNVGGGFMRESYYNRCLPIWPMKPLNKGIDYSCDFYTLNNNNTAYTVFHDDRPEGAPQCCIIANPFHCPPQDFFQGLPVKSQSIQLIETGEDVVIDWRGVFLDGGTGNVTYGFENDITGDLSIPFCFFFRGLPWLYNWCYQRFYNFQLDKPPSDAFQLPQSCLNDDVTWCPGWDPWIVRECDTDSCTVEQEADNANSYHVILSVVFCIILLCFNC